MAWSALDALPPSLGGRAWELGGLCVRVRDGDHAPEGVMHSAAMALWPAEAPPHAPLGFGSLDALDGLAKEGRIVWGEGVVSPPWWRWW